MFFEAIGRRRWLFIIQMVHGSWSAVAMIIQMIVQALRLLD